MRVCFAVSEFFRWGKYGGYGSSTRILAAELVKRGVDVSVVTPRRKGQPVSELVDGVKVNAFPPASLRSQLNLYRVCDADIYHSQEPSLGTHLAMTARPDRVHVVTCRDTRLLSDWAIEMRAWLLEGSFKTLLTYPYENNPLVFQAVRRAHAVFCPNEFSIPIARKKYRLKAPPGFLPSPVRPPSISLEKAERPTVCYIGRWDRRKRTQLFFELARRFPEVRFVSMGQARTSRRDATLRWRYGSIPNLEMTGFIDQFSWNDRFERILGQSWILVNTAIREGLPRSFLEAAFFRCAILSRVDPDGFATRFGYCASRDDFDRGLKTLLTGDEWRRRGKSAYAYVKRTHTLELAVDQHLHIYRDLLARQRNPS